MGKGDELNMKLLEIHGKTMISPIIPLMLAVALSNKHQGAF
jgi:hypothetical protein